MATDEQRREPSSTRDDLCRKTSRDGSLRGALRTSNALAARLVAAEDEIERLCAEDAARRKVIKLPTPLGERYPRMVATFGRRSLVATCTRHGRRSVRS